MRKSAGVHVRVGFCIKAVIVLFGCLGLLYVSSSVGSAPKQGQPPREQFSALARMPAVGGTVMVGAGATANLEIYLDRYSTDAEVDLMAAKFAKGRHKALRTALEKATQKGKIAMSGRNDYYELKLVRSIATENGRRIFAVGERAIRFLDGYYPGRSHLEEFGILQLDLKTRDGIEQGSGTIIHKARIKSLSGNSIVLEEYGIQPVRLTGVRKR